MFLFLIINNNNKLIKNNYNNIKILYKKLYNNNGICANI